MIMDQRKAFVFAVKDGNPIKCSKIGGADAAVFDFEDEGLYSELKHCESH